MMATGLTEHQILLTQQGVALMEKCRDLSIRNFGLRNRSPALAGKNALVDAFNRKELSYKSVATLAGHFNVFIKWVMAEHHINDLRLICKEHILDYAEYLIASIESGNLSISTGQNYLSAVNRVMTLARQDHELHLDPVNEAGMPKRTGICKKSRAVEENTHQEALKKIKDPLIRQLLELQRSFGFRLKESCLFDPKQLLSEAQEKNYITVSLGTKGGKARRIPITNIEQLSVLKRSLSFRSKNNSMIPDIQSFVQFQMYAYQEIKKIMLSGFHGERHAYAHNRYIQLTNLPCPVAAGIPHGKKHLKFIAEQLSIQEFEAQRIDLNARTIISVELGHHRIDITNSYLG